MNLNRKFIIFIMLLISSPHFSNEKIAPYVLDGSLVLYFAHMKNVEATVNSIVEKFTGIEAKKTLSEIDILIRERMSVNILTVQGAESIGIDPSGPFAFVKLKPGVSYTVFRIKNLSLLKYNLDNLPTPIPYRIEKEFIIFSSSIEILQIYNFRGIEKLPKFQQAARALKFNWSENFIWLDSQYLKQMELSPLIPQYAPPGNLVVGTFDVNKTQISFDLYTIYNDPEILQYLKQSMKKMPIQPLLFLEFEEPGAAIIGQTYIDMNAFIKAIREIDKIDSIGIRKAFQMLKSYGVDIEKGILPYFQGRTSYSIRAYNPIQHIYDITFAFELKNQQNVQSFIQNIVKKFFNQGSILLKNMSLFTHDFYGLTLSRFTIWFGVLEGHLIISTNQESLTKLIRNIYENRRVQFSTLPVSFRRAVNNTVTGGQNLITTPLFLKNIYTIHHKNFFNMITPLSNIEWDFYILDTNGQIGRRDMIQLYF